MKRLIALLLTLLLLITALSGCQQTDKPESSDGRLKIVCTTFPQYDWVRQIIGSESENIDLTLLMHSGVDLHNYQPSASDIVTISTCDLFIYVGGESDTWVEDALKNATNKDMVVINLLDALGDAAKAEEIIEGMEEEHDHEEHDEEKENEHDKELEAEYDEHIWLSLLNAQVLCAVITDSLSLLDADNAAAYTANLNKYLNELDRLHEQYTEWIASLSVKTLLFGDRFPFRYLVDDYNLEYYAAFPGCSAETEASFDTIVFLAEKADELKLHTIMVTESADQSIAKTIRDNTKSKDQQILVLAAMQSVTSTGVQDGTTYLSIMESNLNVLKEALQ